MPPPPTARPGRSRPLLAADRPTLAADLTLVAVFVALGRTSHREGGAVSGYLVAAWPFLAGCLAGWGAVLLLRRRGVELPGHSLRAGALVLAGTVAGGMALRRAFTDGGTPVSFLVVATTFLTVFLLGRRFAVRTRSARRSRAGVSAADAAAVAGLRSRRSEGALGDEGSDRDQRRSQREPSTQCELVAVYDPDDADGRAVGAAPRDLVRRDNLPHAATAVLVRRRDGELYVHRRCDAKDLWPGRHDCTAGGVVLAGEDPADAARRELAEELGIVGADLAPMLSRWYHDDDTWYLAHVYTATWDGEVRFADGEGRRRLVGGPGPALPAPHRPLLAVRAGRAGPAGPSRGEGTAARGPVTVVTGHPWRTGHDRSPTGTGPCWPPCRWSARAHCPACPG